MDFKVTAEKSHSSIPREIVASCLVDSRIEKKNSGVNSAGMGCLSVKKEGEKAQNGRYRLQGHIRLGNIYLREDTKRTPYRALNA